MLRSIVAASSLRLLPGLCIVTKVMGGEATGKPLAWIASAHSAEALAKCPARSRPRAAGLKTRLAFSFAVFASCFAKPSRHRPVARKHAPALLVAAEMFDASRVRLVSAGRSLRISKDSLKQRQRRTPRPVSFLVRRCTRLVVQYYGLGGSS